MPKVSAMIATSALSSLIGIGIAALLLIPLLGIGVVVIAVVANRAEPDPTGRRPIAVYLFAASFFTLFVTMFATYGAVARLATLIGTANTDSNVDPGSSSDSFSSSGGIGSVVKHPVGDAVTRGVVLFGLVALVSGAACYLHLRAAGRISAPDVPHGGPVGRVRSSYVAAVPFLRVALAILFAIVAVYGVFQLISPAIFDPDGSGARLPVLHSLLPALYFALLALLVLAAHLRWTPSDQRPTFRGPRPVAPAIGPVDVSPTVVEVPGELDEPVAAAPVAQAAPRASAPKAPRAGDDVLGGRTTRPRPRP
jgi:hypothetical protein